MEVCVCVCMYACAHVHACMCVCVCFCMPNINWVKVQRNISHRQKCFSAFIFKIWHCRYQLAYVGIPEFVWGIPYQWKVKRSISYLSFFCSLQYCDGGDLADFLHGESWWYNHAILCSPWYHSLGIINSDTWFPLCFHFKVDESILQPYMCVHYSNAFLDFSSYTIC